MPEEAGVLQFYVIPPRYVVAKRQDKRESDDAHADQDMEPVNSCHDVVETEIKDLAMAHGHQLGGVRVESVPDMIAPFHIFVDKENHAQNDGDSLEQNGAVLRTVLDRRNSQGHGQTAGEQNDGIDGPDGLAHFQSRFMELARVHLAIDGIQQEQAAEEEYFREQEEPHAELRAGVIFVLTECCL